MSEECPQCRSEKTEFRGLFTGWKCNWCENEWIDLPTEKLTEYVAEGDEFEVEGYTNTLSVSRVNGRKIYLDGHRSGEYYLKVRQDGSATFYRKKSGNERNQFGSKWKRVDRDVEYSYAGRPNES